MSEMISSKTVITRKIHSCWGCGFKYPQGTKMQRNTCSNDGKIASSYWCPTCQKYWARHLEYGDEIMFGELRIGDIEGWEAVRDELQGKETGE